MAAGMQYHGPMYISAHSADVILSDIRPVKFKLDALHALNAFIDEILCSVITSAHSLSTNRLKAGLLRILPTPLGKEALLEAELELRAYWERTNIPHSPSTSSNGSADNSFNLQWAVELMQLKCQAYSTLNDSDEDALAEARLNERMGQTEGTPAAVVAPAALYLTAILECICEHILSNVGRVATRDSSRTTAGVQDLFTALCEDSSMYDLFRRMNVYDQVEGLSKPQKPKRSKSFSRQSDRNDELSPTPPKEMVGRISSESTSSTAVFPGPSPASRTSLEKVKAIKLFNKAHGRSSSEREVDMSAVPRKADGSGYEGSRKGGSLSGHNDIYLDHGSVENDSRDQEFEDLMRSAGTMKMSLTPDRLRTMESPKASRPDRQTPNIPAHKNENNTTPSVPRSLNTRRPSVHHVDSIREDEEPKDPNVPPSAFTSTRRMQDSNPPTSAPARLRSVSTSGAARGMGYHAPNKSLGNSPSLSTMRDPRAMSRADEFGVPKRTRKLQRNRESLDLDDVMNGSGDEEAPPTPAKPTTPGGRKAATGVSQSARDLIAFLDQGPPDEPMPQRSGSISVVSLTPTSKSGRGSGRLQRMISKLSLGGSDKDIDSPKRKTSNAGYSAPSTPSLSSNKSFSKFNNPSLPTPVVPVPPRIPPVVPISPPASPLYDNSTSMDDVIPYADHSSNPSDRARKPSVIRKAVPTFSAPAAKENRNLTPRNPASPSPSPTPSTTPASPTPSPQPQTNGRYGTEYASTKSSSKPETNGVVHTENGRPPRQDRVNTLAAEAENANSRTRSSRRPSSANSDAGLKRVGGRKNVTPSPSAEPASALAPAPPSLSQALVLDMCRMLAKASTADECRLLVDMFMAKAGIDMQPVLAPAPSTTPTNSNMPSPPPSPSTRDVMEEAVIELLLGGGNGALSPLSDGPRQSQEEQDIKTPSAAAASSISSPDTPTAAQSSTPAVQNHIPPPVPIKA